MPDRRRVIGVAAMLKRLISTKLPAFPQTTAVAKALCQTSPAGIPRDLLSDGLKVMLVPPATTWFSFSEALTRL